MSRKRSLRKELLEKNNELLEKNIELLEENNKLLSEENNELLDENTELLKRRKMDYQNKGETSECSQYGQMLQTNSDSPATIVDSNQNTLSLVLTMLEKNCHLNQSLEEYTHCKLRKMNYQNKGETSECSQYGQKLQTNLDSPVTIVDSNQNTQSLLPSMLDKNCLLIPLLMENIHLKWCNMDYQNKGKTSECSQSGQMLQTNSDSPATIVDSNQNMQSPLPSLLKEKIELSEENLHLKQCKMDYQNKRKTSECSQHRQKLQTNSDYPATLEDYNQKILSLAQAISEKGRHLIQLKKEYSHLKRRKIDSQNKGKTSECSQHRQKLQTNSDYPATLEDYNQKILSLAQAISEKGRHLIQLKKEYSHLKRRKIDSQNKGKTSECSQDRQKLQRNSEYCAIIKCIQKIQSRAQAVSEISRHLIQLKKEYSHLKRRKMDSQNKGKTSKCSQFGQKLQTYLDFPATILDSNQTGDSPPRAAASCSQEEEKSHYKSSVVQALQNETQPEASEENQLSNLNPADGVAQ